MLKKKNMAMVMAGVTVATSVAPAFANVADENKITMRVDSNNKEAVNELVGNIRKALNVKFEDAISKATVGTNVYDIKLGSTAIKNATELETAIKGLAKGAEIKVTVKDKGHQTLDGKVVDYKVDKYESVDQILTDLIGKGLVEEHTTDTVTVKETPSSKDIVTVKVGDDKLDFNKKIVDENKKLVGFEKQLSDIVVEDEFVVTVKNVDEIDVNELFDGVRLTSKGMELVKAMNDKALTFVLSDLPDLPGFNPEGDALTRLDITVKKGSYVVGKTTIAGEFHTMKDFKAVLENKDTLLVGSLAGDDRFATSIKVSKEGFEDGTANAVVLVGQDAIVDGLAASPLAAKEKAPILLSQKAGVTPEVEAEMLRVLGINGLAGKTIYIVGGESQISKEAEAKLAKLGTKVERISGDDRYATSLAIAEKVVEGEKAGAEKPAFVVGGNGEVDAMSIAAYAAQTKSPIVVTNKAAITKEAKEFMAKRDMTIVGGTSSVSDEVKAELDAMDDVKNNVERLSGADRQGTNAAVINKFYNDKTTNAFVAKDGYGVGKSHLIDALTAAPLAGSQNAPIVLATNNLSVDQKETAELKLTGVKKIVQIGQGIANTVIEKIVEIVK
ncbi:cell wall-binding repeat-containing protein [Romboutsia sp. 1001285H_161024_C4]|uniref:cell wall-binding repeat-containing protein n=1 Tax=Romboutsia sp. 1001285H_161024_C4 TaxID=2787109 RepID=UPI0018991338|nr:cell wall-binding repeat-containing protein [Romboutsia sp. 1001285H_161024_C4]